jgi:hypothetical protein
LNKYDIIIQNWKKSGIHEGMDETVAKSMKDFTNSNVLLYMHEHVVEYQEAFRLYVGDLSDNAFCESLGSKSRPASKQEGLLKLELDFDPDDTPAPRQRKKETKIAENRRIENHRRWKARHPSEDFSSSQDTCASEINRLDIAKQELSQAEDELETAQEENHNGV